MEAFTALLRQFGQILTWWFTVAPWEQAIRVRAGRHLRLLGAGFYLRIPFVDRVYVQSIRRRVSPLQMQTVSTSDAKVFTVNGSVSYSVADIERLYQTLQHAEDSIRMLGMIAIADAVANMASADCSPKAIGHIVTGQLQSKFFEFGLADLHVEITDFASTRTYRLLMDQKWGTHGEVLDVDKAVQ